MVTVPLITWTYADWRIQSTPAAQLARLELHLMEVSGFVLESSLKGSSLRLSQDYLATLSKDRQQLQSQAGIAAFGNRFGISSFRRGSGP